MTVNCFWKRVARIGYLTLLTMALAVVAGCGDSEPKFKFAENPMPAKTREELLKNRLESSQEFHYQGQEGQERPQQK